MERADVRKAMGAAVEEVLETMCFAGVFASGEGPAPQDGDSAVSWLTARLEFHGNPPGRFQLGVPLKLARAVGAGFLGREEAEVSDGQAGEVVCELANMICGSVLSRLESEETFQITHPELVPQEAAAGLQGEQGWFDLGDGFLATSLEFKRTL